MNFQTVAGSTHRPQKNFRLKIEQLKNCQSDSLTLEVFAD